MLSAGTRWEGGSLKCSDTSRFLDVPDVSRGELLARSNITSRIPCN